MIIAKKRNIIVVLLICTLFISQLTDAFAQSIKVVGKQDALINFGIKEIKATGKKHAPLTLNMNAKDLCSECYTIDIVTNNTPTAISITAGASKGAMYALLDVAEALKLGRMDFLKNKQGKPYLKERGVKFNLPLDLRTPTYSDPSDAFQANMPDMWDITFWKEYLDAMARDRLNTLTLWSLHPFPSMVRVPEYPDVALTDVWRTKVKFDGTYSMQGRGFDKPELFDSVEVLYKMTIDDKIKHWQNVMQLAEDRGIGVYIFTWNAFIYGAQGKHGITLDQTNEVTIDYFRASVREMIKTYPLLKGIGITAGENMDNKQKGEFSNEKWLWRTYGLGINDALSLQPQREFKLIHRFHMASLNEIKDAFQFLRCPMELSLKYAIAHMYSIHNPPFTLPAYDKIDTFKTWLTIRNDDIYSMRWSNVDFARNFIKSIPALDKIAGFYMGPDGYCWGKDYLSKLTIGKEPLVHKKQWMSNLQWNRLSYDPTLPNELFDAHALQLFGKKDGLQLLDAWEKASMIFPYITRTLWGDIDLKWFPEANTSTKSYLGFYNVDEYIIREPMAGSNIASIGAKVFSPEQCKLLTNPNSIADTLELLATDALDLLNKLPKINHSLNTDRNQTLSDIYAFSQIGMYYAFKLRAAYSLAMLDQTCNENYREQATLMQTRANTYWDEYTRVYHMKNKPAMYNRVGLVDLNELSKEAIRDLDIIKDWKCKSIKYVFNPRTERPFRD